jgi:hypothetical protein
VRGGGLPAQVGEEVEDLSLTERSSAEVGLVQDEQPGLQGQDTGDRDPLGLSAGSSCRYP